MAYYRAAASASRQFVGTRLCRVAYRTLARRSKRPSHRSDSGKTPAISGRLLRGGCAATLARRYCWRLAKAFSARSRFRTARLPLRLAANRSGILDQFRRVGCYPDTFSPHSATSSVIDFIH